MYFLTVDMKNINDTSVEFCVKPKSILYALIIEFSLLMFLFQILPTQNE